jgi:peptidoglycan-associated lipoprotein
MMVEYRRNSAPTGLYRSVLRHDSGQKGASVHMNAMFVSRPNLTTSVPRARRGFPSLAAFALFAALGLAACSTTDGSGGAGSGSGAGSGIGSGQIDRSVSGGALTPDRLREALAREGVTDRVLFSYDSSDLSGESRATIDKWARVLNQAAGANIVIEGHCDERGTREYNLALGERRAAAVRSYLTSLGVSPARVQTLSYGKEKPVMVGSNEQAWAQNRRGVLTVE